MTPLLPSSTSSNFVTPGNAFVTYKNGILTRNCIFRKSRKQVLPSQRYTVPLSTSIRLFPQFRVGCALQPKFWTHVVAATGTDVAVEETDSPNADKDSDEVPDTPSDAVTTSADTSVKSEASKTPIRSKRSRPIRKSEMPPVKNEDLIPGATFSGKVRSIQPFGAFVDFGAFTDGLVHLSNLSDSFVKDVTDVVSVGQEVTVRLLEANTETGRISLTMRENDKKEASIGGDSSRPPRKSNPRSSQKRDEVRKSSKFVKGQELEGTVKNLTRSGAFISLPEGEEGFLPASEEADEGFGNIMGGSSLEVGQEVKVRVLRLSRGQVTLTMKTEDTGEVDAAVTQGVIHVATNPFVLAFRKNKDIAAFLDDQEKEDKQTDKSLEDVQYLNSTVNEAGSTETVDKDKDLEIILTDSVEGVDGELDSTAKELKTSSEKLSPEGSSSSGDQSIELPPALDKVENGKDSQISGEEADPALLSDSVIDAEGTNDKSDDQIMIDEVHSQTSVQEEKFVSDAEKEEEKSASSELNGAIANSSGQVDVIASPETSGKENEVGNTIANDQVLLETSAPETTDSPITSAGEKEGGTELENNGDVAAEGEYTESVQNQIESIEVNDEVHEETPTTGGEVSFTAAVGKEELERNGDVSSVIEQDATPKEIEASDKEDEAGEDVDIQTENIIVTDGQHTESPSVVNKESSSATVGEEEVEPDLASNANLADISEQSANPTKEATAKAAISPALVKQLREETGAGMMDCKKALSEAGGDIIKAQEYLRKKGLASADKKASRTTAEGRIGSYIHDSRIGVLIEVNCETDFVSRGDIFKELVDDLAMQVAACPQVQYVGTEEVPQEIVIKEREIEMQKEDLLSKPEQIRSKIVDGRIRKRLEEMALLDQPYIKNDKLVVKDWVKQTIATIGENIKVRRFLRFNLGEGLEKKSQDFAAEVAAQTTAKPAAPGKEQPAASETKETAEKPTKAAVSAALVKQLREETGAGMMDCKKALSETGGDLEKAQEYLRKKGLSTADKKSSRLAAEGRIGSYIHDSRIGVLIEVNCETDFVGRSEKFKELVDDLAMQVVACPQVQYVSVEDIPTSIVNKEKELEMQREDLQSKPANIRERIVEGRISKRLGELALLEQPFIKDDSILVKDLVKQRVAAIGENIKVRRFVKFTLGEDQSEHVEDE